MAAAVLQTGNGRTSFPEGFERGAEPDGGIVVKDGGQIHPRFPPQR